MVQVTGVSESGDPSAIIRGDLSVDSLSSALEGRRLDLIVSGSVGAVESVRLIRSLRRLGAKVTPWLTAGGSQFTTETALAWAAGEPVRTSFSGHISHLAENDACVIAPASANFLSKIAYAFSDSPALALVASYRGSAKPIFVVPNMHDSLWRNPSFQDNVTRLRSELYFFPARIEEGKQKFPIPNVFADWIGHQLNLRKFSSPPKVLLTMGSTRGYIDDVRFFGNDSSGKLGTAICSELFRQGCLVDLIIGPCPVEPDQYHRQWSIRSTKEMETAVQESLAGGAEHGIFCAAVLDYEPVSYQSGKIPSTANHVTVDLKPTKKIIRLASSLPGYKVGFKLQPKGSDPAPVVARYLEKYGLDLLVHNYLGSTGQDHEADCYRWSGQQKGLELLASITGKQTLAQFICRCILEHAQR